jgi:ABC-2 type transport system ATP-binding protein
MIKLENIKKDFKGTTVLQNVNVTFENGKTYAIIGSSGAGKSRPRGRFGMMKSN